MMTLLPFVFGVAAANNLFLAPAPLQQPLASVQGQAAPAYVVAYPPAAAAPPAGPSASVSA